MAPDSADPPAGENHSARFLEGLAKFQSITLISHVHPDPDSLGSMLGVAHLVRDKLGLPARLTRDGYIGRAENRAMVEVLNLELLPLEEIDWPEGDAVIMVDSQPNTGRHTIPEGVPLYAVLDHHETGGETEDTAFVDVRSDLGATCTLVTEYLQEQRVDIPAAVATGLFYGIESELTGYPREASPRDDQALHELFPLASMDLLARIRNARLPHRYFETLLQALQNSFIYDRLIISWAGDLPQPELTAEIADFLIRFEEVDWSLCAGIYQEQMVLSVRTTNHRGRAGLLLQQVVGRLGRAGGHDRRAGGCIPLTSASPTAVEQLQGQLRKRFLKALHIDECRGQRLVSRKEILQSLQA
jgi:nanoRNase/pAp phosphatase (c-di-AMP/oligoRNAs hydrolase)